MQNAWLCTAKTQLSLAHRTVRWCTGQCSVCQAELWWTGHSRKSRRRTAIIHRTVRWCTGLFGEPTVGWANGRPRNPRVTRGRANGQMGAPDSVRCANGSKTASVACANFGRKSGTGQCPVVHQTVRCTTRLKARFAFLDCFQRLLGPLCL
jgi:hypothetical protein